ncbi:hypothetical protein [Nostoc sp.]|uniref:hypothetical protein n=1 Tax=Nostoc sp. TaxID=1180 RepID=UPI002FF74651
MSNSAAINLDRLAAQHAQNVIKNTKGSDVENTVTKALGILQEDGVYACFLYLLAKEKENGKAVVKEMLNLLEKLGFGWNSPMKNGEVDLSSDTVLNHIINNVTHDLQSLLLTKETLEQMLIYARYGAKACQEEQEEKKKDEQEGHT